MALHQDCTVLVLSWGASADLQCPRLSWEPNNHYENSRYGNKTKPCQNLSWKMGRIPCQHSFLLVSSQQSATCQTGNLTFGCCMCQCSLECKKLLGWNFPLKRLYLAEMFNKTLHRERYFIQKNVLSLVTPLTLVEEVSFLSWWWFICSIKSNDKVHGAFNGTRN